MVGLPIGTVQKRGTLDGRLALPRQSSCDRRGVKYPSPARKFFALIVKN
jgi:hypothetical protein